MAPTHSPHRRGLSTDWWLSGTGLGVRCAIAIGIVVLLLCLMWISRWHVERRVDRGLKPLWYHRWLAPTPPPVPGAPRIPLYGEPGYREWRANGGAATVWRRTDETGMENHGATELSGLPPYSMDVPPAYKPVFKADGAAEHQGEDGAGGAEGVTVRTIDEGEVPLSPLPRAQVPTETVDEASATAATAATDAADEDVLRRPPPVARTDTRT